MTTTSVSPTMSGDVRTLVDALEVADSPRPRGGRIWLCDAATDAVYSTDRDGNGLRAELEVPEQPSGLGWLPDGRLLVVSRRDARILRLEHDGSIRVHAELARHVNGVALGMVVDHVGRAWVCESGGDLRSDGPFSPGRVLRVDPDGTVTVAADDLLLPHGSIVTDDAVLLICESAGNRVTAFDIGGDGVLGNRRIWARFGPRPTVHGLDALLGQLVAAPAGCVLGADGSLWVADALHGRALLVRDGRVVEHVGEVAPLFLLPPPIEHAVTASTPPSGVTL
ncbi:SMP-30/gluconolactonase/LRE family protein [Nocardioides sp. NPDC101246]|uniref:SMP-30/gluconolactonase/LRE family protein n=1 Tax=Nocardioides sp. NPDC101246 TaxID=3364336 RepID=UPI003804390B